MDMTFSEAMTERRLRVEEAIHQSHGERTTLGLLGNLICGCCGLCGPAETHYDGGVWVRESYPGGKMLEHVLICKKCGRGGSS
jgi:hypothetical protein